MSTEETTLEELEGRVFSTHSAYSFPLYALVLVSNKGGEGQKPLDIILTEDSVLWEDSMLRL